MATQLQRWFPKSLEADHPKSTKKNYSIVGYYHCPKTDTVYYLVEEPPQSRLIFYAPWNNDAGDSREVAKAIKLPLPWLYRFVQMTNHNDYWYDRDHVVSTVRVSFSRARAKNLNSEMIAPILPNVPGVPGIPCCPSRKVEKPNATRIVETALMAFWSSEFNEDGSYWDDLSDDGSSLFGPLIELLLRKKILDSELCLYDCDYPTLKLLEAWSQLSVKQVLTLKPEPQFLLRDLLAPFVPKTQLNEMKFNFNTKYIYSKLLRDE